MHVPINLYHSKIYYIIAKIGTNPRLTIAVSLEFHLLWYYDNLSIKNCHSQYVTINWGI